MWDVILQVDVQHPTIAVEFLDDTFGVAVGNSGELDYSTDGGETWSRATGDAARSRAGLDVVDERVAWLVGVGGRVWLSTDGARNWRNVTRLPYSGHVEFMSCLDARTGWAASAEAKRLWATADGGQTWEEIPLTGEMGSIVGIALRTANDGYLLDNAGMLHRTGDGGKSWSAQTLGLDKTMAIPVLTPSTAMRFFDAEHGLIVLSLTGDEENEIVALRTADGGQTWARETVSSQIGTLYLTHDGTILTVTDLINSARVTVFGTTSR